MFFKTILLSQIFVDGYYVNLKNDTIFCKIEFTDVIKIQSKVKIISQTSDTILFSPQEINEFVIFRDTNLIQINFKDYNPSDDTSKFIGLLYSQINNSIFKPQNLKLFDTLNNVYFIKYKSISLGANFNLFAEVSFGNKNLIQAYKYYHYHNLQSNYFYFESVHCVILTFKEGKYVKYKSGNWPRKYRKWISRCVSEDTLLVKLIRKKIFPTDYKLTIETYNEGRLKKENSLVNDTLPVIKGILDANKEYKTGKMFWPTFAASTLAMFPGFIVGGIKYQRKEKEYKVKVPIVKQQFINDEKYKLGYQSMLNYKNEKAISKAILLGSLTGYAIIFPTIFLLGK